MSGSRLSRVYWDTGIFLALLTREKRPDPADLLGIAEQVARLDRGEMELMTSVITLTEVLESHLPYGASERFERIFERPNYHLLDVNAAIARIAHNIRDYYSRQIAKDGLPTVTTPDALHLASAIFASCETFYTFDERDRPGSRRALVPLSGMVAGRYLLMIGKPKPGQVPKL